MTHLALHQQHLFDAFVPVFVGLRHLLLRLALLLLLDLLYVRVVDLPLWRVRQSSDSGSEPCKNKRAVNSLHNKVLGSIPD